MSISVFNILTVQRDGKLFFILVKDKGKQKWKLCGGGANDGETPQCTAEREILEEVGLFIEVQEKLLPLYEVVIEDKKNGNIVHKFLVFAPKIYGGKIIKGEEIQKIGFFSKEKIDELSKNDEIYFHHCNALYKFFAESDLDEVLFKSLRIKHIT